MDNTNAPQRPLILITNDDGIAAPGIRALTAVAVEHADVIVAAPDGAYSGQSHSITVMKPLAVREIDDYCGARAYAVAGSPVDCIKLAVHALVPRCPTLVLSGINHGSNASASVHYSGTLGAVREAAMLGIAGIGFSLCSYDHDADFSQAGRIAGRVIDFAMHNAPLPANKFYNVNIPVGDVRGIRQCRVAQGHWVETPTHHRAPYGTDYYWLEGTFVNDEPDADDTDEYWLAQGYATISPCQLDATDYNTLSLNIFDSLKLL